ncbi:MAG: osmoprotectant transporter permease [Pseudomonadota bacterium]
MKLFWTFFAIDTLVFAVLFFFFLEGLSDGSVSSFNMGLWLLLIGVPASVLAGGLLLNAKGRTRAAKALLATMAVPGLLAGAYVLLIIVLFASSPGAYR